MLTHDAYLRAVLANPDDPTPRLAYADWLDENGVPGAASLRIPGGRLERESDGRVYYGKGHHNPALVLGVDGDPGPCEGSLAFPADDEWFTDGRHARWAVRFGGFWLCLSCAARLAGRQESTAHKVFGVAVKWLSERHYRELNDLLVREMQRRWNVVPGTFVPTSALHRVCQHLCHDEVDRTRPVMWLPDGPSRGREWQAQVVRSVALERFACHWGRRADAPPAFVADVGVCDRCRKGFVSPPPQGVPDE